MERYRRIRPPLESHLEHLSRPETPTTIAPTVSAPTVSSFKSFSYIRNPVPVGASSYVRSTSVDQPLNPRRLRIALIGAPNAGKTSLFNTIVKEQIGAVSAKKNTTRERIEGIFCVDNFQFEFVDCPGIVPVNQSVEARELSAQAWLSYNECDCALIVVDTVKRPDGDFLAMLRKLRNNNNNGGMDDSKPMVLVLNKADLVENRKWLKIRNNQLSVHANFSKYFSVSAKFNLGVDRVIDYLKTLAVPGNWQFDRTTKTTLPKTQQLEQLIRGHLFTWFNKDVPYRIEQRTVGWTERLDGSLIIEHELIVKDSVVARMILGSKNDILKKLKQHVTQKLQVKWGIDKILLLVYVKPKIQRVSKRDKLETATNAKSTESFFSRGMGS